MQKLITKISLLTLIVVCLLLPLDRYYGHFYRTNLDLCNKTLWILNHQEMHFQDAFIGSSRVLNMIDLNLYHDKTGRTCINLGTSGTGFGENYLILRKFIEQGNSIDTLFVQVDIFGLDSKNRFSYPFHDYQYMPWLHEKFVQEVYKDHVPFHSYLLWKYVPYAKYLEFNNQYDLYKTVAGGYICRESGFDPSYGSLLKGDEGLIDVRMLEETSCKVDSIDLKYFKVLVKYALSKQIKVVLYQAPVHLDWQKTELKRDEVLATFSTFAEQEKLPYYPFDQWPYMQEDRYFRDYTHLNKIGTSQFTDDFISALSIYNPHEN